MDTHMKWREQHQKTVPLLVGDMEAWRLGRMGNILPRGTV